MDRSFRHTLRRKPGAVAALEVEVDADRLARQTDRVFERHNQHAKIPGFRPGKAPRPMYERAYGRDHLWQEAGEDLVDETYREIIELEQLSPLDRPEVAITQLAEGKPLRFTATVSIRPDVALGDYAAHGAAVDPKPPTDDEVEATVSDMRDAHAEIRPVERAAKKSDVLTVDIDVTVEGKMLPPFARNAHLEAGRATAIAGLGEGLVGMKAGEEKALDLAFAAEGGDAALQGKSGRFAVRVSQVSEKILPGLDDEFAKTVGVESLERLRRAVRNELAHAAFHEARDAAADKLLDHLLATTAVELPDVLVQDELDHMVADLRARLREQGLTLEQFLLQARKTEQEVRDDWRTVAERRAKSLLVLDAVAKKECVTVTGKELAQQVAEIPLAQQDPQALRSPAVLAALARSIRNRKVVDKLIGLESPDAEREAIRKAGGDLEAESPHGEPAKPAIIVPAKTDATPQGREAIRSLLK